METYGEDWVVMLNRRTGGRGTFGRFKNMVHRHGIADNWYRFREEALKTMAKEWLGAHGIRYRE
jgi:hypothetical protein